MSRFPLPRLSLVMLLAGVAPLIAASRTSFGNDLQNVFFKASVGQGARAEVVGTLGGSDEAMLRFFDAGKEMRPSGSGHAWLAAADGTFDRLCIAPAGNMPALVAIEMNLHAAGAGSVTFTAHGAGDAGGAASDTLLSSLTFDVRGNGSNRLTFELPGGSPFTQLDMESTVGIENIRQVRVGVVPEPTALAATSLGAAALLLRRRGRGARR